MKKLLVLSFLFCTPVFAKNGYFYIGAEGSNGTVPSTVYRCDSDWTNCKSLVVSKQTSPSDYLGASLYVDKNSLFLGAPASYGGPLTGKGEVYKCDLDGSNCAQMDLGINQGQNTWLGFSTYKTKENFYVSAPNNIDFDERGTVYRCDLQGENCSIIDPNVPLDDFDMFGSAFSAYKNFLYIGALGTDNAQGAVYRCSLDGSNCKKIQATDLSDGDSFGSSIFASKDGLYVGATQHLVNGVITGTVYRCDLDGNQCVDLAPKDLPAGGEFGSSLYADNKFLYVGAMTANNSAGAIYKCNLDGSDCVQIKIDLPIKRGQFFGSSLFRR